MEEENTQKKTWNVQRLVRAWTVPPHTLCLKPCWPPGQNRSSSGGPATLILRYKILNSFHLWFTNSELISKHEIPPGVQNMNNVFPEPVTQCCEVWMPDKLYLHPGYWHGTHSHDGPSAWTVFGHSRGTFLFLTIIVIIFDCLSPAKCTYNVHLSQGKGMWNVCLCGAHLWD